MTSDAARDWEATDLRVGARRSVVIERLGPCAIEGCIYATGHIIACRDENHELIFPPVRHELADASFSRWAGTEPQEVDRACLCGALWVDGACSASTNEKG